MKTINPSIHLSSAIHLFVVQLFFAVFFMNTACADSGASRTKTFTVSKGGNLEVTVSGGDIAINTWDKNEVSVRAEGIDDDDLEDLEISQSDNTVRVDFRPRWGFNGDARFDIRMPQEFDADVHTSGGNIDLRGVVKGRVKGTTSGGDVTTGDVEGTVTLRTSGGDVRVGSVSGETDVSTSGGNIRVEKIGKSFKGSTAGGDIQLGDVGGDANVTTAGGDITVGKVSGSATLRTAGGSIELQSASGRVSAKTAGGDLELRNITGSVEGKTSGGNVTAELTPSGKGDSELSSSGGDVTLYIDEHARATIEAEIRLRGWWRHSDERYDIHSDFKAAEYHKDKDEEEIYGKYILNGGGEDISLKTSAGNIEIRKLVK
ncbi:MAG: DUF4097 family beta strand repeat protein [Bacteroidota bacterium]|nr:DUF4097 family beta strand repeat protein [Bacteroidota bacterium]